MSSVLQTIYASAPVDDFPIRTLELKNPDFNVEGHLPGSVRLVQGFDDIDAGLEGGSIATFKKSGFGISLPQKSVKGRQDLNFTIDNVTGEILKAIDDALEGGNKTTVIARVYTQSNLSTPAERPVVMTATGTSADYSSVSVTAGFHDLVNKAWPFRRYTPSFAPGLKYYG